MDTAARKKGKARASEKRRPAVIFLLAFLFFTAALAGYGLRVQALYLVVSSSREGTDLYRFPARAGQEFALEYTHSVTKRQVRGTFALTGEKSIKPLTTSFDAFGPGLPYLDNSVHYIIEKGIITVFHDEEPRESLRLFVSPLTGELLHFQGKSYELGNLRPEPFLLEISLEEAPLLRPGRNRNP
jgi:hypothetical protein